MAQLGTSGFQLALEIGGVRDVAFTIIYHTKA